MRYGIKNATTELLFQGASINSGEYNTVTAAFEPGKINIYLNGTFVGNIEHRYSVMDILSTGVSNLADCIGYIGKSLYIPDPAFIRKLSDFKVYNYTLSDTEVQDKKFQDNKDSLTQDHVVLSLGNINAVTTDLVLPVKGEYGSSITWTSSNPTYLTDQGKVTRPKLAEGDQTVELTALLKQGENETERQQQRKSMLL